MNTNRSILIKRIIWDILYYYEIVLIIGFAKWIPVAVFGLISVVLEIILSRTERGRKEQESPLFLTDRNNLILLFALTLTNSHHIELIIRVTILAIAAIYVFWESYERAKRNEN